MASSRLHSVSELTEEWTSLDDPDFSSRLSLLAAPQTLSISMPFIKGFLFFPLRVERLLYMLHQALLARRPPRPIEGTFCIPFTTEVLRN